MKNMLSGGGDLSVGFFCPSPYGLGDIMVSSKAFYVIKHIYKAKIIFFGRAYLKNLIQNFELIDIFQEIPASNKDIYNKDTFEMINSYNLDFIISVFSKSFIINFLKSTNVKYIIVNAKFSSIFSFKCRVVWLSFVKRFYRKCSVEYQMLYYVRKINPKLFDLKIKNLECNIQIKTKEIHRQKITAFVKDIGNPKEFILINPFSLVAKYTLDMRDWINLTKQIHKKYPKLCIIVPTYEAVHQNFIEEVKNFDEDVLNYLYVFKNDEDILNLCELLAHSKLLISPSTGTIHLASNLKINSIGLYSMQDIKFWETYNKDYVLLKKKRDEMNDEEVQNIIEEVLKKLENYL